MQGTLPCANGAWMCYNSINEQIPSIDSRCRGGYYIRSGVEVCNTAHDGPLRLHRSNPGIFWSYLYPESRRCLWALWQRCGICKITLPYWHFYYCPRNPLFYVCKIDRKEHPDSHLYRDDHRRGRWEPHRPHPFALGHRFSRFTLGGISLAYF